MLMNGKSGLKNVDLTRYPKQNLKPIGNTNSIFFGEVKPRLNIAGAIVWSFS